MWRCTQAGTDGYTAAIIVQFDLTGPGYSNKMDDTSARGSGAPLISSTLRAEEALNGIDHVLGITVPNVGGNPIYPPATHTDGGGSGGIEYGMRFVLRPDYPVPPNASVGVRTVIQALKTYGAYVVDQGADFEMDADFTHPELWKQAGLSRTSFDFTGADMRPAQPGAPAPAEASSVAPRERSPRRAIALHAHRHAVWVGGQLRLRGKVRGNVAPRARVRLQVRTHGHWRRFRKKPVEANGTFATWPHLGRVAHASRSGKRVLRLRARRLRSGVRVLRVRAVVHGVGRSRVLKIRVRRHHAHRAHHRHHKRHRHGG
jgi:hypothetical protein